MLTLELQSKIIRPEFHKMNFIIRKKQKNYDSLQAKISTANMVVYRSY